MKFTSITSILLLCQVNGQSSCPSDLTQELEFSSTGTLFYEVVDGVFCARIESESEGWLGFGISPSGSMAPAEVVIGLPDEGTVLKYDVTSESTSGVVAMSDDKQTLIDSSVVQEDGRTVMTFAKIMDEDEYPLILGDNTCIYAQAGSNAFGYHGGSRGSFNLPLTTPAPSDTEVNSNSQAADNGSFSVAQGVTGMMLFGAGTLAILFGL